MKHFAYLILITLFTLPFIFCSGTPDEGPVSPKSTYKKPNPNLYYEDGKNYGYSKISSNKMVVKSVDTFDGSPEYEYLMLAFQGLDDQSAIPWASNTTELYIDMSSDKFYILQPQSPILSLLSYSNPLGYNELSWNLKYTKEEGKITLKGTGLGSFVDCSLLVQDYSYGGEYVNFNFTGSYNSALNGYEGTYKWVQISDYDSCNMSCSGSMVLLPD